MKDCKEAGFLTSLRGSAASLVPLVAAVVLVFGPGVGGEFLNFDDAALLTDNPQWRGFSWTHWRWFFTTFHMGHYMPLTWASYALDHAFGGLDPVLFRATNLALHAANAGVFFFVARAFLGGDGPPVGRAGSAGPALLAALLFALHPARVESVSWITERRDLLSALFLQAAVLAYLRGARRAAPPVATVLPWQILSLLCKAWAITLPVVFVLLDALSPRGASWDRERRKAPLWAASAAAAVLAGLAQRHSNALFDPSPLGWLGHALLQAPFGLLYYPFKFLVPVGLSPFDEHRERRAARGCLLAPLATAAAAALLWRYRRRAPRAVTAVAAYAVLVSPVLGFFQSGFQFVADRYAYVAGLPLALLAAGALAPRVKASRLWAAGAAAVLCVWALRARTYARVWTSDLPLWGHAVRTNPRSAMSRVGLGAALLKRKDPEGARARFAEALRENPRSSAAYLKDGEALEALGRRAEAEERFRAAAALSPGDWEPFFKVGDARRAAGDLEAAEALFARAAELRRGSSEILCRLAVVRMARGRWDDARRALEEALRAAPLDPHVHNNLGIAAMSAGDPVAAEAFFRRAVELAPDFSEAWVNFGFHRLRSGRSSAAGDAFRRALALAPESAEALAGAGLVARREGRHEEAETLLSRAFLLKPGLRAQFERSERDSPLKNPIRSNN